MFLLFRNNSLKNYGLCPSPYLSASVLSCDSMLNMIKVELELIPDPDIHLFFEKDMEDGVSYISKKYNKANNKYLKSHNSKQESKSIIYLDPNNLYGYVISSFLRTSGFKWVDPKDFDLNKYTSNSSKGCVSEVILNILKNYANYTMIIP